MNQAPALLNLIVWLPALAAVLIALQLTADHWFFLYLVWFAPLTWLALLGGSARSSPRAAAATPAPAPR